MASRLGYSEINNDEVKSYDNNKNKKRNRTYKNKPKVDKQKIETFLNSIENNDDDNDESLANFEPYGFNPPELPKITKQPNDTKDNNIVNNIVPNYDEKINNNLSQSYNDFIPYYTQANNNANVHGSKDILMKKLNYMIHLLEEDKDEKTNNVAEELILYAFLGVFIIFIVDSFSKASNKYTR